MTRLNSVCVFCGSNLGNNPAYAEAAQQLGRSLADDQIKLVYGGAKVGLMGTVADAALAAGGSVTGVIPKALMAKEIAHDGLTELHVVDSMHQRKALMAELADAFIALPGGLGTYEELFEMLTWAQLGLQKKPCAVLNVDGFYCNLIQFLDDAVAAGFMQQTHREMLIVADQPAHVLQALSQHQWRDVEKWIDRDSA